MAVIACEESAAEGENLIASKHPVFVHGSTSLSVADAEDFIARLRSTTRAQALELKAGSVLLPRHRKALLAALPALDGQALEPTCNRLQMGSTPGGRPSTTSSSCVSMNATTSGVGGSSLWRSGTARGASIRTASHRSPLRTTFGRTKRRWRG